MNCRLCKTPMVIAMALAPTPIESNYSFDEVDAQCYSLDMWQCPKCNYVGIPNSPVELTDEITGPSMHGHLERHAHWLLNEYPMPANSLIVDIGSNDGTFLSFFSDHGVVGVEPGKAAFNKLKPTVRVTLCSWGERIATHIRGTIGLAHYITANRVMANIDDLQDFVDGVKVLLHPDGVFVFETGYLRDILDKMLMETIYHEHLSYDLVKPLALFFYRNGLILMDVERTKVKGGSIRGIVRHSDYPRGAMWDRPRFYGFIASEFDWCRGNPWTRCRDNLKAETERIGNLLKGTVACGYGAGVPGASLLYKLGLERQLDFLVDDDEQYHGKRVPGSEMLVGPSSTLFNADACVILAHRYADQIMAKHPEYEGEWIIPFRN